MCGPKHCPMQTKMLTVSKVLKRSRSQHRRCRADAVKLDKAD